MKTIQTTDGEIKVCSPSPMETVGLFIEGIMQFNLTVLKSLIIPGISLFAVFGDGDEKKGMKVSEVLYHHPEKLNGKNVGSAFEVKSVDSDGNGRHVVLIERYSQIIEEKIGGQEHVTAETSERRFSALLDPRGNCLANVRPIDNDWKVIKSEKQ
jgi:hypothetical protein